MAVKKTGLGKGLDSLFPAHGSGNGLKQGRQAKQNKPEDPNKSETKNSPVHSEQDKPGKTEEKKSEKKNSSSSKQVIQNIPDTEAAKGKDILKVKITQVEPNRSQPRRKFDEDALLELAESIRQFGVLQPLLVQKKEDYYEIIAGERRWRAAKLAGIKEVPVIVKEFSDLEVVEISLIENIQREDLNPIEEAQAYQRLLKEFHLKQDEIAERVSKSRTTVTNSMRLLKLDERVQQMVIDDMITTGHARALLSLENGDLQYKLAQQIFDEKMSVRDVEKLVRSLLNVKPPKPEKEVNQQEEIIYHDLEEKMKASLGTQVSIKRKNDQKGKIEIEYYSYEELERLMYLFQKSGQLTKS